MRRHVDFKFIACVLVGLVALGVGVHFLHAFQVSRSQALLLRQAEQAEGKEDPGKTDYRQAARYLQRYLGYRPSDTDTLARLGKDLDEAAKQSNSDKDKLATYKVLDQVVLRDPERSEARRRAAELAIYFGEYAHAKNLIEPLAKKHPNDGDLQRMQGICAIAAKEYDEAIRLLKMAVRNAPDNLEGYEKLAALYQLHLKQKEEADRVVDEMVKINSKSPRALLSRAKYYWTFYGQDKQSGEHIQNDLTAAGKMGNQDADALLLGAALARDRGDLKEARRLLQGGLAANRKNVDLYMNLMAVELQAGDKAAAKDVLRRGLQELPREWRLLAARADLAMQSGNLNEAELAVKELGNVGGASGPAQFARDLFAAQVLMRQLKWGEAVVLLEGLRLKRVSATDLAHDLELLLGLCHDRLGNPDKALVAYRRALELKPLTSPARFSVGAVLLSLGRPDEAVASYREALRFKDVPPRLRLSLARALIARDARLPEKKRSWEETKKELDQAAKDLPGDPEVAILQAEVQLREEPGRPEGARAALTKAKDASPDRLELWLALAELAGQGRPAEALQVLDDAARQPALRDRLELRLARLRHAANLPDKEARAALDREKSALPKAKDEDRRLLRAALGNAYLRLGAKREAEDVWGELAREQPDNLALHLILLDLALERGAGDAEIEKALKHIRRVEGGAGGPYWHFGEAARLFRQVVQKDPPPASVVKEALGRARQHLAEAVKLRPSWSRAPALLGEINAFEGRKDDALTNYRQAVRLGDRRPDLLRQYMRSVADAGPSAEDKQLVGQLAEQRQDLLTADLGKAAAGVLFTAEGAGSALALARKAVPADSKNYRDHLWLGQLVAAAGAKGAGPGWKEEAQQALTKARDLAPKEKALVPWLVLYNFLRETDQKQQAEAVLAQSQKALAAADAATILAVAREAAGDLEGAEKHFLAAMRARPANDATGLNNLATFYFRTGQPVKAEPYLQTMLNLPGKEAEGLRGWVRRALALAYVAHGDLVYFEKALASLEDNKKSLGETAEDVRVRATVLATQAVHRKEAIGLLKKLNTEQMLADVDKGLLVRLLEADNDWGQAQTVLLDLLNSPGAKDPAVYAHYIDRLQGRKQWAQAERWLEKLEQLAPQAFKTKQLRARALAARGKDAEAVAPLQEYASRHANELAEVALAMEFLGPGSTNEAFYFKRAEEMYRDLVKGPGKADSHLKYAAFLGRRGRVKQALDECERAKEKGAKEKGMPEEAATTAVAVLGSGNPDGKDFPAQCKRVEDWLRAEIDKGNNPPAYLSLLALYYDQRGDYRQAITFNREALRRSPNNIIVLNNLAWLLALKEGNGEEALQLIEKAVKLVGPLPALLDTRGSVLLALGKSRQAIPDLSQAVALRPTAEGYFRLARALWPENQAAARNAFEHAQGLGLRPENLHLLERGEYQPWLEKFAAK
jgi:tetratricopeptide (TPR) repeat protein